MLTDVTGFADGTIPVLLPTYGVGAAVGNVIGGRLSDRAPMAAQLGLLAALAAALVLIRTVSGSMALTAIMVFVVGAPGFSVIPGTQARVLGTAAEAPTPAMAVNAPAYQLAAAPGAWLGGRVVNDGPGLRSIHLIAGRRSGRRHPRRRVRVASRPDGRPADLGELIRPGDRRVNGRRR
ncbi:MFS transporter [Embleya scabrispora]|uniref:MFS transporter n=1 Tax=Embleya scabrispora TaxID=159449 RepID=UPI0003A8422E|nr:MFS transporter [Embleya scabrispora]MYS87842.1 hypothetical protein [Streptomyces sp. SID5474]